MRKKMNLIFLQKKSSRRKKVCNFENFVLLFL